ncbi:hypothetical protein DKE39_019400 (plasmid) [Acinetobacter baumannii]|nr:hypothetical protein DKE39_019400 [Acinetobacter baumannii]
MAMCGDWCIASTLDRGAGIIVVWANLEVKLTGLPMCAVVCLVIKIRMSPEVLIFIFSVGQRNG